MKPVVWIFDSVLVLMSAAVGFFSGLAGRGMVELMVDGAWASVIILTVFALLASLVVFAIDRDFNHWFPSGIKPAPSGTKQTNKYEQRRKRNGWIGFFVGAVVAIVASMFLPLEQIMGYF